MNRTRKHQIIVRLNDEEKIELERAMSVLSYERRTQLVKDALTNRTLYANIYRHLILELSKQGNNLNQIARKANTDTSLSAEILDALRKIKEQNAELLKYVSK
ncbi:MobC family plasmid mobilization relaxosome protein [Burkholderia cenocepacia]|uniref:plasmid mobilization relaxosome protein MobC n=1 Tax=Burkholderia TaxID=32008 RepID=UPI001593CA72|nr:MULTISPECIES: plasmid mobilization relaxosome protein MobC [Burkholderia]MDN7815973.1 plasmid mobilization relaxosome protein MobC [Burkholderia vietnamiensis]MDR8027831.1 MobC family plasmid mobilization relaxosome protein [Burkholderia cenocepacia]MDR8090604.1 MobC family plasmid mobilization relaxosome protein [Burkholderia gladioli]